MARLREERLLVVASYRSDDLHRRHPLRPLLAELTRLPHVQRLDTAPFRADDMAAYLASLHGSPLPESTVLRILDRSGGNAYFAQELLGALRGAPVRALLHHDVVEPRGCQPRRELDPAEPLADALVVPVDRLPAGEHGATAGREDPVHPAQGDVLPLGELDRVDAQHGLDRPGVEPRRAQVAHPELGGATDPPRVRIGLTDRLAREVHADQPRAGARRHLQAVAPSAAREVEQDVARGQRERRGHVGDAVPRQQARGQQVRRQPEVTLLDLVLQRRVRHARVPLVEVRGRPVRSAAHRPDATAASAGVRGSGASDRVEASSPRRRADRPS